MQKLQDNANDYNKLRQNLPGILSETSGIMYQLEGNNFCNISSIEDFRSCSQAMNGILLTGMTQTINAI